MAKVVRQISANSDKRNVIQKPCGIKKEPFLQVGPLSLRDLKAIAPPKSHT